MITSDLLQQFKYLEAVIKESLRMFSTVPVIGRKLEEDVKWSGGTLPKDLTIIMVTCALHLDPEYHPDPENFNPDRFLSVNSNKIDQYSYIPFSSGPRNCIGS